MYMQQLTLDFQDSPRTKEASHHYLRTKSRAELGTSDLIAGILGTALNDQTAQHLDSLSLEGISKPFQCNHDACEFNESVEELSIVLKSRDGSPEVLHPAECAFDFPSPPVTPEFSTVLGWRFLASFLVRCDKLGSAFLETTSQRIAISGLVVDKSADCSSQDSFVEKIFDQANIVSTRRRNRTAQGDSVTIDEQHRLCTFAALGLPNVFAPFFAAENIASAIDSSWLILAWRSNLRSKRAWTLSQIPDSVHSLCRRQHVELDGNRLGMSDQRAPVRRIQSIPSKHARGGIGGRPPFGSGGGSGKNSDIRFHWSSVSCNSVSILEPVLASKEASRVRLDISGLLSNRFYEQHHNSDQLAS